MANIKEVRVPDIGSFKDVEIIEIPVKAGDVINADDTMLVLESDKATMDVPAPFGGKVKSLKVKVGDKVSEGSLVLTLEAADEAAALAPKAEAAPAPAAVAVAPAPAPAPVEQPAFRPSPTAELAAAVGPSGTKPHASPSVRAFARELGVDLTLVNGSGPKRRILKEDVQAFVKNALAKPRGGAVGGFGFNLPEMPAVDFAQFGPVEAKTLSKVKRISGPNLHRNWVAAPHVTQFDESDITDLEAFRKAMQSEAEKQGAKLTLLPFMVKAVIAAMKAYPDFNASLSADGESLILKKYFHIGFAVDTPDGLVVPVIRDADKKSVFEIAKELAVMSAKARDRKLGPADMQGGCFTITSLGGIGGTYFTPILNSPEVAILGVSRSSLKPVWNGKEFAPRLMLPLSLSYDHRVIDGVQGARFTSLLGTLLADVRRLLL
jgi:pyruvate dehydrogenase E2 component (dihydrolipoamide acetyltransferase)